MKKFLPLLLLPLLFLSCENPKQKETNDQTTTIDPFREDVLKLRRLGLLKTFSDKDLDSLIVIYRKDTLNGLKNLLVKSGDLLQLDLNLNGQTPVDVYNRICLTVAEKYPDLKNDSIKFAYLHDDPKKHDTDWVLMRQRIGNEAYSRKLYYFNDWPIDETFCKIYNVRLASEKKDYRIFLVDFMCEDCANPLDIIGTKQDINTMGIIRLTKTQSDSLLRMERLALDPIDEFKAFGADEVETKIKQFELTGMLQKKDSLWWRERKDEIRTGTVYGMEDMYDFLDTLFCTVSFDTLNDYNPYEDILKSMKKISRGKFNIGAISDEVQDARVRTVRYTFKGKVYKRDMEERGGILFPGIIEDANNALEEQKAGGAFYTVLYRDNILELVYLDNAIAEKAKASGFFSEFIKGVPDELKGRYESSPPM
jgi:hypothetical protein